MATGSRDRLRISVECGSRNDSHLVGQVIALRRGHGRETSATYIPIEVVAGLLALLAGDIYLLTISHRFGTVPRDLVRIVGGVIVVLAAIWTAFLVIAVALTGLFVAVVNDVIDERHAAGPWPWRTAAGLAGCGAGVAQGALVAGYGPVDFASSAVAIMLAVQLRRSAAYRRRRHSAATMGLIFLALFAVSSVVTGLAILAKV